jgi:Zn finger protein HypA/HybF involved in hydrogenase expression
MSSFAEVVQALLVIVVIGLAMRNARLKREKELLSRQLGEMQTKEEEKSPERIAATEAKQEIAAASEIEKENSCTNAAPLRGQRWTLAELNSSCPQCGSIEFEMRTYGGPWEYADTHCAGCGKLILRFDEDNTRHLTVRRIV